jgi:hypothetical protein
MDLLKISEFFSISTDSLPFDDEYAVENLISADEDKRKQGFISYSSSTPINFNLESQHKFNLHSLKVSGQLSLITCSLHY